MTLLQMLAQATQTASPPEPMIPLRWLAPMLLGAGLGLVGFLKLLATFIPAVDKFFSSVKRREPATAECPVGALAGNPVQIVGIVKELPREWVQRIEILETANRRADDRYEQIMKILDQIKQDAAVLRDRSDQAMDFRRQT